MKALVQLWRQMTARPVRQAFGVAPQDKAWALVGLSRHGVDGVRVQGHTVVQPPDPLADVQVHAQVWRQALTAVAQPSGRSVGSPQVQSSEHSSRSPAWTLQNRDQRLQLAWPADRVVSGQTEFSLDWPDDDCTAEVQLAVAQALNLPPEEVNFDWQVQPGGDGLVRQVIWVGCAREELAEFKRHIRAARWKLAAVEPEIQAAQRAARVLKGGLPSLLTRPTQDWQFSLNPAHPPLIESDPDLSVAVQQALFSPAGPRLVACGLALRAWM